MRKMKNDGITLIALVITIIVLLILAGVSIAMLTGNNGILKQAEESKNKTEEAKLEEERKLDDYEDYINKNISGLPKTEETIPYLPNSDFYQVEGTTLDTGVVIKDKEGNSYVWIEVPKNTIYKNAKFNTDYEAIEKDLQNYAINYRGEKPEWTDTWYEGSGIENETAYNTLKNKMLQSIYDNGGFWISQYEIGSEVTRSNKNDTLTKGFSKEGMYPYCQITCSKAQTIANNFNSGNKTSSLLFGLQWDLVCKYIETKGAKTQEEINTNSSNWGNYLNESFEISNGKYSIDSGVTFTDVVNNYKKEKDTKVLLTTGASERNKVLNIYDFAGNVYEWTLENTNTTQNDLHCVLRGGSCIYYGNAREASLRYDISSIVNGYFDVGFRVTIY